MRQSRATRVLRGAVAASVATFVALLSHIAGGGPLPGLLWMLTPWVFSIAISVILAGRALSLLRLSFTVGLSQVLFHGMFALGAVPTSGLVGVPEAAGVHVHGGAFMLPALGASAAASPLAGDAPMWAMHAVGAIVTTVALYRGERAVLRLLQLAAELVAWVQRTLIPVQTVLAAVLAPRPRGLAAATALLPVAATSPHLSMVIRRGPPLLSV